MQVVATFEDGEALFRVICERGLEGVVAKGCAIPTDPVNVDGSRRRTGRRLGSGRSSQGQLKVHGIADVKRLAARWLALCPVGQTGNSVHARSRRTQFLVTAEHVIEDYPRGAVPLTFEVRGSRHALELTRLEGVTAGADIAVFRLPRPLTPQLPVVTGEGLLSVTRRLSGGGRTAVRSGSRSTRQVVVDLGPEHEHTGSVLTAG